MYVQQFQTVEVKLSSQLNYVIGLCLIDCTIKCIRSWSFKLAFSQLKFCIMKREIKNTS